MRYTKVSCSRVSLSVTGTSTSGLSDCLQHSDINMHGDCSLHVRRKTRVGFVAFAHDAARNDSVLTTCSAASAESCAPMSCVILGGTLVFGSSSSQGDENTAVDSEITDALSAPIDTLMPSETREHVDAASVVELLCAFTRLLDHVVCQVARPRSGVLSRT